MKYLSALFLATALIVAGCTDSGYTAEPLPPVGTKGLFTHTVLTDTVSADDILSGKDTRHSLCWVSQLTPIVSVHNSENKTWTPVRAMLEENAKADPHYRDADHTDPKKYAPCTKGAIIRMEAKEFASAVRILRGREKQRAEDREAEKAIRQVLEQKK